MLKNNETYHLTKRDKEIMDILWNSSKSLMASEIVNLNNFLNIHTVQASLKKLLHRNLIEIAKIDYSGTVLSRSYRPTISARDYETQKYLSAVKDISGRDFSTSQFVAALLSDRGNEEKELAELQKLEDIILKRKQEIIEEQQKKTD